MSKIGNDTFSWKIKNFSELISSDSNFVRQGTFTSKCLDNSQWILNLFIFGYGPENHKFINIYLNKGKIEKQPEKFIAEIDFTITILATDISSNISRKSISNIFRKDAEPKMLYGFRKIVSLEELYAKRSLYLSDDILSVECYIEGKVVDPPNYSIHPNILKNEQCETIQKSNCKIENLGNDLLRLYLDSKFCDIKIVTVDQVFSVHKSVICARSPVFNAMFENDTKEKNSCVIDIPDVHSATMNRMLLYMYSDVVEDMDLKEAEKLYVAADKYEVLPLKQHCSFALKSNISVENLGDIYTLADMHQDNDLKTAVEGYIFIYTKKVYQSSEWKNFMQLNPQLSAELMHKVWIRLLGN